MEIEEGPKGPKESKIENLHQFLDFLEEEFGKNTTGELFKRLIEHRAMADRIIGDHAKPKAERIKRLKKEAVTPVIVAKLNQAIDLCLKRHPERLKENLSKEKKEMLNAIKGKEIVMDGKGNIEVKTQKE